MGTVNLKVCESDFVSFEFRLDALRTSVNVRSHY